MAEIKAAGSAVRRSPPASACPGLFRIVPAKDGGICRVKIPLGRLSCDGARAIGDAARRFGSGAIEVTNRANIQIRGVAAACEAPLIDALLQAGLGPTRPEADDIRNVMVSPLAGLDRDQIIDATPIATELLAGLESDARFGALSPKFCIFVDGGEGVAFIDHPHDIWLSAIDAEVMALGFAGTPIDDAQFVTVRVDDAAAIASAAIHLFLAEAAIDSDITRMRDLLQRKSLAAFLDRLAREVGPERLRAPAPERWRRRTPTTRGQVGLHAQRQAGLTYVGAVPPLGRLSPLSMARLAAIAEEHGADGIRLTPWQSVVLPSISNVRATSVRRGLEAAGFTCDPQEPLAAIITCSGSTGCKSGLADTKSDAMGLAEALDGADRLPDSIHFSGCAKSCASARIADVTLLASAAGTYTLFQKSNGSADKFGRVLATNIGAREAAAYIRKIEG